MRVYDLLEFLIHQAYYMSLPSFHLPKSDREMRKGNRGLKKRKRSKQRNTKRKKNLYNALPFITPNQKLIPFKTFPSFTSLHSLQTSPFIHSTFFQVFQTFLSKSKPNQPSFFLPTKI